MATLARSDDVRRQNTQLILGVLRDQQAVSRTRIAEQTGLSAATVSTISSQLLKQNILRNAEAPDTDPGNPRRGRPQVTLSLNAQAGCIAVINLALNHLGAQILDYAGNIKARATETINTLHLTESEFLHALTHLINRLLSQGSTPGMPLRYIAMGVQGLVDAGGETMLWSPITPLRNLPIRALLHRAFRVPVWVANDCNMIVEALRHQHPGQFGKDFAAILLAQGIGMGLMLRGQRFIGRQSSAGEFGHMTYMPDGALCRCGQRGCIEAYAGDYAIWRRAQGQPADTQPAEVFDPGAMGTIISKARQQEGMERTAYQEAGQAIGHGLRSLFALIDPVPVAFVGYGTQAFDLIEPEILRVINGNDVTGSKENSGFSYFDDAEKLIQQGCSLIALRALDQQFSQMES